MIETFITPASIDDAVRAMSENAGAAYLSGGTELNSRASRIHPTSVVSLSPLGLRDINYSDESITIGAMVTLEDLCHTGHPKHPFMLALRTAAANVGNRNIRNMATLGGNICACKSCSDMLPLLLALDSKLQVHPSPGVEETVSVADYIAGPRIALITDVVLPVPPKTFFIAIRRYTRTANDLALVNVTVGLDVREGSCNRARVSIGGVAARPVRIPEAEAALTGQHLDGRLSELSLRLESLLPGSIEPITDHRGSAEYKMLLTRGLLIEAFIAAAGKGGVAR